MANEKETTPKDPINEGSLLWPIFIALCALVVSAGLSLYDEGYVRRPYKTYQNKWLEVARRAYQGKVDRAEREILGIRGSADYQALDAQLTEEEAKISAELQATNDELNYAVNPRLSVLTVALKETRSRVAATKYLIEHAREEHKPEDEKLHLRELKNIQEEVHDVRLPAEKEPKKWNFFEMTAEFNRLKEAQSTLQRKLAALTSEPSRLRAEREAFVSTRMVGPSPTALTGLMSELDSFVHEIKQIHVKLKDGELIDRCESCHLGARKPVELTLAEVDGRLEYTSHPKRELLQIHDPEQFGCSPCHGGNGIATDSVEKGHGYYKHWLWPLHRKENQNAGCVQCHGGDIRLDHGDGFNEGKWLFNKRGCWACHKYEGFGQEWEDVGLTAKQLEAVAGRVQESEIRIAQLDARYKSAEDEAVLEKINKDRTAERQNLHLLTTEKGQLAENLASLSRDAKRVGPNLKEVRAKLHPEWLHAWLMDPLSFRPDTKMPQFRISADQGWDIAAYLWQSGEREPLETVEEGDAERGAWVFKVRGCLGCHKMWDDDNEALVGDGFAATLTRFSATQGGGVGEKARYDYLVSWIKDPRAHNVHTVMPSLRLDDKDARDVASWLVSKKRETAGYVANDEALTKVQDTDRFERGEKLVRHLGCFSCHEIKGLETEGRIGTELTEEGSKPLERLDFGLFTHRAKHGDDLGDSRIRKRDNWYDHKGFFEHKLARPEVFDEGRYVESFFDQLRMPNFHLAQREIDVLSGFLIGSVEANNLPKSLRYQPEGQAKDIQDGWWVVKKYNCVGCHQVIPEDIPALWKMGMYTESSVEGVPGANGRPPTLVGQGSRTDPVWLSRFLADPSLDNHGSRNGVRQGLNIRMPSFELSENERGKLVRFFTAMAKMSPSYVRPDLPPLVGDELDLGRAAFTAGDCANCHLLGGEANINPDNTYAPSFEQVAQRIRPGWVHKWVTEPNAVIPGTAMPAILNQVDGENGTKRWVIKEFNDTAQRRLGPDMVKKLTEYTGDHADLLVRYFALWNETEAAFQKAARLK